MAQHATQLHKQASLVASTPARPIALDLASLVSPYRRRGRFTLRIENLPQGARLTAGRNNGDRTWSLALDELDELFYSPPEGFNDDHVLVLRLIAKEEGNASTLALIELPVRSGELAILQQPPQPKIPEAPRAEASHGETLNKEISSLKAELAGRDQELSEMRAATQSLNGNWQAKLETAIAAAKNEWSSKEASRLAAAKVDHEKEVSAFRELKNNVSAANALLVQRESELAALKAELTEQRRNSETEISTARKALEDQSARDAYRREQSAKTLQELKARCDDAEADLLRQRQASEAEIAAAKSALAEQGASELDKQELAASALADLTARCEQAEANLRQQRRELETEILAARKAAEEQDATEAERAQQAARMLAELQARCEAAESALRSAHAEGERAAADDAYVNGLNQEIKNLQAVLVDREAAIARAEASLEQMQVGVVAKPPPTHWEPLPGNFTTQSATSDVEEEKPRSHLVRDFILVFAVVTVGCVVFFFGQPMLANLQSLDLGNLFASSDTDQDESQAAAQPAPAPPPKPVLPVATVVRDVNLRATPSTSADIITGLKQGATVTILERQGNWDHVEVVISGRESRQGWAYGSYLAENDKNPAPKP
ncbi:MAG TPA: SH3 domain-containing protein [Rhizomicrobium sp.]|nr:SH3 domain-containing protein [Rhizomicrobium sp.]